MDQVDLLLDVVRGEREPEALADLGIVLEGVPGSYRISEHPTTLDLSITLGYEDLAIGFLRHWALGSSLPAWSATILLANCFCFPEKQTHDYEQVVQGLWDASVGEPVSQSAVEAARRLSRRRFDMDC